MASFWCGNTLPKGYFKNTKTYENITGATGGQTTHFFTKKNLTKLTVNLPQKLYGQFMVW